jgi:hypothetical protein
MLVYSLYHQLSTFSVCKIGATRYGSDCLGEGSHAEWGH